MPSTRTSEQVREEFFSFFQEKDHTLVESASLVPRDDPSLLFTNAGMNQFKDVFLGTGSRPYDRAVDTQKCLRVSGKHNDLEEVGHDTYHHTFFEMLGNWSFGDYFKKEAVRWAWELLTEQWGLEGDRLYATVHEGDETLGLDADEECASFWRNETDIDASHILYEPSKDNFWMMGDMGPCGPCSEIHIDLRSEEERRETPGVELVNADHPEVMEIWNLVFIQFNALGGGELEPLAAQHVDTGMGFERMTAVLQGVASTYDTDLFAPLLQKIAQLSPRAEVAGYNRISTDDPNERERIRVAMRVVVDHIRTIAFAVADGVTPGNTGRGYVIRRILRRAVRYGYQTLDFQEPFLHQLLPALQEKMSGTFPDLVQRKEYLQKVIRAEEESFLRSLEEGLEKFNVIADRVTSLSEEYPETLNEALWEHVGLMKNEDFQSILNDVLEKAYPGLRSDLNAKENAETQFIETARKGLIPGDIVFLLHDTYGFPSDLTALMAGERNLAVDSDRFEELMQEQKDRARAAGSFDVHQNQIDTWDPTLEAQTHEGHPITFLGYDTLTVDDARILKTRTVGEEEDVRHELILNKTPFYAESGGQVGDTGVLAFGDKMIRVLDTRKDTDGTIIHVVARLPDALDAPVRAEVDAARRLRIRRHHTATHLMHAALREVLGNHVTQKGSLVAPDRLRFDFSHFEAVTPGELREVEQRVNEIIRRNVPKQEERDVPMDEALERGAMALFGEKYGDHVRVITFDPTFSVELCGGTHAEATGELGLFRFVSEGSVAAGVRRVEAVAGEEALATVHAALDQLENVRGRLGTIPHSLEEEVASLLTQNKSLQKENERLRQQQLAGSLNDFLAQGREIGPLRLVTGSLEAVEMDALRALGQTLRERMGERTVGVLGASDPQGEKAYLVAAVSDDLVADGLRAGELVGKLARRIGGGGGGRPQLATAGGREPQKLEEALAAVEEELQSLLFNVN